MADKKLQAIISAKDQFSPTLKKLGTRTKSFAKSARTAMNNIGSSVMNLKTALVSLAAAFAVKKFLAASAKQEMALARVTIMAEKQGVSMRNLEKDLLATTAALQNKTVYGDEEQLEAMSKLMSMGVSYEKSLKTLPLLLDMASSSGQNLATVSMALARGLEGDITSLQRYAPWITKLTKENKNAEYVIEEMTRKLGGHAERMAKTMAGQMIQFNNMVGDMIEKVGDYIAKGLSPWASKLKESGSILEETAGSISKLVLGVDDSTDAVENNIQQWTALQNVFSGIVSTVKWVHYGITSLRGAFIILQETSTYFGKVLYEVFLRVQKTIYQTIGIINNLTSTIVSFISNTLGKMMGVFRDIASYAGFDTLSKQYEKSATAIKKFSNEIVKSLDVTEKIKGLNKDIENQVEDTNDSWGNVLKTSSEQSRILIEQNAAYDKINANIDTFIKKQNKSLSIAIEQNKLSEKSISDTIDRVKITLEPVDWGTTDEKFNAVLKDMKKKSAKTTIIKGGLVGTEATAEISEFTKLLKDNVQTSLTDGIYDGIVNGFKNAEDIVRSFAQSLLKGFIGQAVTGVIAYAGGDGGGVAETASSWSETIAAPAKPLTQTSNLRALSQQSNIQAPVRIYNVSSPSEVPPDPNVIVNIIGNKLQTDNNFRNGIRQAVQ